MHKPKQYVPMLALIPHTESSNVCNREMNPGMCAIYHTNLNQLKSTSMAPSHRVNRINHYLKGHTGLDKKSAHPLL